MVKGKLMCQTCANSVNGVHCTRHLTMSDKSRLYKKCQGYKVYVPKPKYIPPPKVDKPIDYEALGKFGKFLKKGGGYSFRTGEYIGVE